jgi:hypothetical protein
MRKIIIVAALLAGVSTAGCQTTHTEWSTDDGRAVSSNQFERERAGCIALAMGSVPVLNYGQDFGTQISANIQAGAAMDAIGANCLRAKGFVLHNVPNKQ